MKRLGVLVAVGVLMTSPVQGESLSADPTGEGRKKEKETGGPTIMQKLQGAQQPAAAAPPPAPQPQPQPEASEAKPAKAAQTKFKRRKKKTARRKPSPEPSQKKVADAEAQWWEKTGNPVVFTFSECVGKYATSETRTGSKSSYPEFVTAAMNGPCKGQFDTMAQVLLERHGETGFRKIAKELITTTFIPAVKLAAEQAQAELDEKQAEVEEAQLIEGQAAAQQDQQTKLAMEAELRQAKEAMLDCFAGESDRLASTSSLAAERLVGPVIDSCRGKSDAFFMKLHALYPDAAAGLSGKTDAVLDGSYRPAIVTRINSMRAGTIASGK